MKQPIGEKRCPDCQAEGQTVFDDGRKCFLKCEECGAMVNWQTRAAAARIRAIFASVPEDEGEADTDTGGEPESPPSEEPKTPPEKTDKPKREGLFF